MATAAWMRPLTLEISSIWNHCHLVAIYNVLAYYYNVTIILNRWLTCFMAYKRCRCVFSAAYSLRLTAQTTKQNLRNCLIYGLSAGLLQGIVIATIRCILGRFNESKTVTYVTLTLHPVFVIFFVSCFTLAILIRKLFFNEDDVDANKLAAKNFLNSIVVVAVVCVVTQSAGLFFLILRGWGSANATSAVVVRQIINCVNMVANFFVYLAFSRQFRVALKRIIF